MNIQHLLRSIISILLKLAIVITFIVLDSVFGIPILSSYLLFLLAPRISTPIQATLYLVFLSFVVSSLFYLQWTSVFLLVAAMYLSLSLPGIPKRLQQWGVAFFAIVLGLLLFLFGRGQLSLLVVGYGVISLVIILISNRRVWLRSLHSRAWYIR